MPMGKPFPVATNEPQSEAPSEAAKFLTKIHENFKQSLEDAKNVPEYVPPPQHPGQVERTRLEMEAGRARVAEIEKERAAIVQPAPVVESEPVYRPPDYVPDMKHGHVAGRTIKAG